VGAGDTGLMDDMVFVREGFSCYENPITKGVESRKQVAAGQYPSQPTPLRASKVCLTEVLEISAVRER
jgi:hypothetical protein